MEYRPRRLKVRLLPWDDCSIEQLVINLEKSGFISIYSVDGQQYLKVHNFEKHQNPHKNERDKGSEVPPIDQADAVGYENINSNSALHNIEINRDKNGTDRDQDGTDRADSFNLIPSYLNPDSSNLIPDFNTAPQSVASEGVVVEALPTVLPKPKQAKKTDNTEKPTTLINQQPKFGRRTVRLTGIDTEQCLFGMQKLIHRSSSSMIDLDLRQQRLQSSMYSM